MDTGQADAQKQLDAWGHEYNHDRPHESLNMAVPASRLLTTRADQRIARRLSAVEAVVLEMRRINPD